jgi:hypothetical protein
VRCTFLVSNPTFILADVRTKLDADAKLLPARSLTISVRCYESRVGRVNTLQSNVLVDYTQVLWSKPDDVDYEPVGSLDYPFRVTVPVKAAGFSTAVFVDYRCLWRIEAGASSLRHCLSTTVYPPLSSYPRSNSWRRFASNKTL